MGCRTKEQPYTQDVEGRLSRSYARYNGSSLSAPPDARPELDTQEWQYYNRWYDEEDDPWKNPSRFAVRKDTDGYAIPDNPKQLKRKATSPLDQAAEPAPLEALRPITTSSKKRKGNTFPQPLFVASSTTPLMPTQGSSRSVSDMSISTTGGLHNDDVQSSSNTPAPFSLRQALVSAGSWQTTKLTEAKTCRLHYGLWRC